MVEWFSVHFWTKWLWVWVQLQSLKLQILCLFWARSPLTFRHLEWGFTLKNICDIIRTYSQTHCTDRYLQHSSIIWTVWLNGWVFVYELKRCEFSSSCFFFFFFFFFFKKDMCLPLSQFPFDQVCQFTVHSWLFCANQLKTSFQLNWNRVVISSDPICLNLSFTLLPLLCGISNIQLFCFEKLIKEKYYSLWRPCKIYKERPFSNHLLDNWIIFFPLKLKILGTNLQLAKTWSC